MAGRERVICPHCGAENPKSIIVTTCQHCRGSLQGAQVVLGAPSSGPPPPTAPPRSAPPSPTTSVASVSVSPPTRAEPKSMPLPSQTAPTSRPITPRQPQAPPAPAPRPVMPPEPIVPPAPRQTRTAPPRPSPVPPPPMARPPVTPPFSPPSIDDLAREVGRRGPQGLGVALAIGLAVFLAAGVIAATRGGGGVGFVLIPILAVAAILIARAWITASAYEVVVDPSPGPLAIGETFSWGVRVTARRELVLLPATVAIRCQEHAIRRSGKSTSHYRRTIHEQRYSLAGRSLAPGEVYELRPPIAIPPYAIPSRDDGNHRIEWVVELQAPTNGICANIRRKVSLRVAPKVTEDGHADDRHVPAAWLASAPISHGRSGAITPGGVVGQTGEKLKGITVVGEGVMAALEMPDGLVSDHGPVLPAGTTREMKLIVEAHEAIRCRALRVWVGCRIAGKGSPEHVALFHEESVYEGDLAPGRPAHAPIRVTVPPTGPVTYAGEHVRFEWLVRVRVDVPFWRDRVLEIPFIVTPQAVQPGS